jgi:outer membrane protein assembly factor BamB
MKSPGTIVNYTLSLALGFGLFFVCTGHFGAAEAADWPNWRGPNYNGISDETGWVATWPKEGPKILWEKSIGRGFCSITVSKGRVYTMGNIKNTDIVYCFDEQTGRKIWRRSYPCPLLDKSHEGGPAATPTVHGEFVYTFSKQGDAFCLKAATGDVVWHKNLTKEFGAKQPDWYFAGSPLIVDNLVIYNAGTWGIALNKADGSFVWQNGKNPAGYATPVPFTADGKKCVAIFGAKGIVGLAAATGKQLWHYKWETRWKENIADPIIVGDKVFISSGIGMGCTLLRINGSRVTPIYRNTNMKNHLNSSVLWKGYLYGFDEKELKCLNFETGNEMWSKPGFGKGSLMLAGGNLIILSEKGRLLIARASPEKFIGLSSRQILSGKCWTVPALANGRIYARNAAGRLVCVDVRGKAPTVPVTEEWPNFRGPNWDGKSAETGLLKEWPESGPELLWSATGLGIGYSSVSIADGKIFTMGDREGGQWVIALDLATRDELWAVRIGDPWETKPGSRCTPTVDGKLVYAIGTYGDLLCLETEIGNERWRKNFVKDFGGKMMTGWGYSESPRIDGDRLICTPGAKDAAIVALDKKTGDTIWKAPIPDLGERGKNGAGYSSIVIAEICGIRQYLQMMGRGVIAVRADNGKFLWNYNKIANGVANIPMPVVHGDYVFCTTSYKTGSALLKIVPSGNGLKAEEVYFLTPKQFENHHGGVVLVDGYIYGGDGQNRGAPVCLDMMTGNIMWKEDPIGKRSAALLYADGHLYFRYEKGLMALVEATPERMNVKSTFKISGKGPSWPHPVILDGKLYLRYDDVLYCYDVRKDN